jgi:hypothetical protein
MVRQESLDRAGHQLLAAPRLADDQDGHVDLRDALDPTEERLHRDAPADHPVHDGQLAR